MLVWRLISNFYYSRFVWSLDRGKIWVDWNRIVCDTINSLSISVTCNSIDSRLKIMTPRHRNDFGIIFVQESTGDHGTPLKKGPIIPSLIFVVRLYKLFKIWCSICRFFERTKCSRDVCVICPSHRNLKMWLLLFANFSQKFISGPVKDHIRNKLSVICLIYCIK